jgi:hypothetical protein
MQNSKLIQDGQPARNQFLKGEEEVEKKNRSDKTKTTMAVQPKHPGRDLQETPQGRISVMKSRNPAEVSVVRDLPGNQYPKQTGKSIGKNYITAVKNGKNRYQKKHNINLVTPDVLDARLNQILGVITHQIETTEKNYDVCRKLAGTKYKLNFNELAIIDQKYQKYNDNIYQRSLPSRVVNVPVEDILKIKSDDWWDLPSDGTTKMNPLVDDIEDEGFDYVSNFGDINLGTLIEPLEVPKHIPGEWEKFLVQVTPEQSQVILDQVEKVGEYVERIAETKIQFDPTDITEPTEVSFFPEIPVNGPMDIFTNLSPRERFFVRVVEGDEYMGQWMGDMYDKMQDGESLGILIDKYFKQVQDEHPEHKLPLFLQHEFPASKYDYCIAAGCESRSDTICVACTAPLCVKHYLSTYHTSCREVCKKCSVIKSTCVCEKIITCPSCYRRPKYCECFKQPVVPNVYKPAPLNQPNIVKLSMGVQTSALVLYGSCYVNQLVITAEILHQALLDGHLVWLRVNDRIEGYLSLSRQGYLAVSNGVEMHILKGKIRDLYLPKYGIKDLFRVEMSSKGFIPIVKQSEFAAQAGENYVNQLSEWCAKNRYVLPEYVMVSSTNNLRDFVVQCMCRTYKTVSAPFALKKDAKQDAARHMCNIVLHLGEAKDQHGIAASKIQSKLVTVSDQEETKAVWAAPLTDEQLKLIQSKKWQVKTSEGYSVVYHDKPFDGEFDERQAEVVMYNERGQAISQQTISLNKIKTLTCKVVILHIYPGIQEKLEMVTSQIPRLDIPSELSLPLLSTEPTEKFDSRIDYVSLVNLWVQKNRARIEYNGLGVVMVNAGLEVHLPKLSGVTEKLSKQHTYWAMWCHINKVTPMHIVETPPKVFKPEHGVDKLAYQLLNSLALANDFELPTIVKVDGNLIMRLHCEGHDWEEVEKDNKQAKNILASKMLEHIKHLKDACVCNTGSIATNEGVYGVHSIKQAEDFALRYKSTLKKSQTLLPIKQVRWKFCSEIPYLDHLAYLDTESGVHKTLYQVYSPKFNVVYISFEDHPRNQYESWGKDGSAKDVQATVNGQLQALSAGVPYLLDKRYTLSPWDVTPMVNSYELQQFMLRAYDYAALDAYTVAYHQKKDIPTSGVVRFLTGAGKMTEFKYTQYLNGEAVHVDYSEEIMQYYPVEDSIAIQEHHRKYDRTLRIQRLSEIDYANRSTWYIHRDGRFCVSQHGSY